MITQNSSSSSEKSLAESNSINFSKQISPSIRWCFTLNNPKSQDKILISSNSSVKYYIIGDEVGVSGTPHLQGYIEFNRKLRPLSLDLPVAHWEKARCPRETNILYCSKDNKFISNFPVKEEIRIITNLRPWQSNIINIITGVVSSRLIYWFWEERGGIGKSELCKYLVVKHGALILSNKANDMKHGIVSFIDKHKRAPKLIVVDIPRSVDNKFISYTGFEEVKNGCFFSPKYESDMCVYNSPHFIVFANEPPNLQMMSADRWVITKL